MHSTANTPQCLSSQGMWLKCHLYFCQDLLKTSLLELRSAFIGYVCGDIFNNYTGCFMTGSLIIENWITWSRKLADSFPLLKIYFGLTVKSIKIVQYYSRILVFQCCYVEVRKFCNHFLRSVTFKEYDCCWVFFWKFQEPYAVILQWEH